MSPRPRSLPGLLSGLLGGVLVGLLLLVAPGATAAPRAAAAQPTDVFTGTVSVVRQQVVQGGGGRTSYTVTVQGVFLGGISTRRVSVITAPAFERCRRGALTRGSVYAFALRRENRRLVAASCDQVQPLGATVQRSLVNTYGPSRSPLPQTSAPEPVTPTLEAVPTSDPTPLTRLAAPGVALVLIGLLGLVVVRRLGRPRRA